MGIRKYKPTTPGRRGASVSDFAEITRSTPEKSLIKPLHGKGGRNAHGRITTRHKGGGHKRAYRVIDFRRNDFPRATWWSQVPTPTSSRATTCRCATSRPVR